MTRSTTYVPQQTVGRIPEEFRVLPEEFRKGAPLPPLEDLIGDVEWERDAVAPVGIEVEPVGIEVEEQEGEAVVEDVEAATPGDLLLPPPDSFATRAARFKRERFQDWLQCLEPPRVQRMAAKGTLSPEEVEQWEGLREERLRRAARQRVGRRR